MASPFASIPLINTMMKKIKRSLFSESTTDNFVISDKSPLAVERCQKLKKEMSVFQSKLMELESQKEEVMMELTIQSKLLRAQIRDANEKMFESDCLVNDLSRQADENERKINYCMVKQLQQRSEADKKITTYRQILEGCISEMNRRRLYMRVVESKENNEEKHQFRTVIINQIIQMEAVQKKYKTMEKDLSEQEAELRNQKEQIMKSKSMALITKCEQQDYVLQLQNQLNCVGRVVNEKLLVLNTGIYFLALFVEQSNNLLEAMDDAIQCPPASSSKVAKQRPATWCYSGDGPATCSGAAFDLRAYIEAGGHRLNDIGDDLLVDGWSCRGFLEKLSGATGGVGNGTHPRRNKWLKRWFVLDRQSKTLSYYRRRSNNNANNLEREAIRDKEGGEGGRTTWGIIGTKKKIVFPRASIEFQNILSVFISHTYSKSKEPGTTFVVNTTFRTYHLSASTEQTTRTWMDAILSVTQRH